MNLNGDHICRRQWDNYERRQRHLERVVRSRIRTEVSFVYTSTIIRSVVYRQSSRTQHRQIGSMKKDLHCIALRIYQLYLEHGIGLEVEWIPCTEIERADFISRLIDLKVGQITSACFNTL